MPPIIGGAPMPLRPPRPIGPPPCAPRSLGGFCPDCRTTMGSSSGVKRNLPLRACTAERDESSEV
eukprot:4020823-Prymnesium_polylepis.1